MGLTLISTMSNRTQAHVIANGPSIVDRHPDDDGVLRIVANRACKVVPRYDWLVFGDEVILSEMHIHLPAPRMGMFCPSALVPMARLVVSDCIPLAWEWTWMPEDFGYSANIALWLAATLGAVEIHAWGFDHHGAFHADGTDVGPQPDVRWAREKKMFNRVCLHLEANGRSIIRH